MFQWFHVSGKDTGQCGGNRDETWQIQGRVDCFLCMDPCI